MLIVSNSVKLATIFPDELNLNGDQANLLVLQQRLKFRGVKSEVISITGNEDFRQFDFIFLGHGSLAAWSSVLVQRPSLFQDLKVAQAEGSFIFAVASGYQKLASELGFAAASDQLPAHRSEFVDAGGVVGYVNTDSALQPVLFDDKGLMTLLHGPILAKNPELADELIAKMSWSDTTVRTQKLDELDSLAALSRETAFEH